MFITRIVDNIKDFLERIVKVLEWSKIIWEDQDWDYDFLLDIIRYKLCRMQKYFESSDVSCDNNKTSEQIKEAIRRLDILTHRSNDYENEIGILWDEHFVRFPVLNSFTDEGFRSWTIGGESRESFCNIQKAEDDFNKKANNNFFNYLKQNYESWWD